MLRLRVEHERDVGAHNRQFSIFRYEGRMEQSFGKQPTSYPSSSSYTSSSCSSSSSSSLMRHERREPMPARCDQNSVKIQTFR